MNDTVTIHLVNNEGGGFADRVDVPAGSTIVEVLRRYCTNGDSPDKYQIRVNGGPVARDYQLQHNDRLIVSPTNVKGAA